LPVSITGTGTGFCNATVTVFFLIKFKLKTIIRICLRAAALSHASFFCILPGCYYRKTFSMDFLITIPSSLLLFPPVQVPVCISVCTIPPLGAGSYWVEGKFRNDSCFQVINNGILSFPFLFFIPILSLNFLFPDYFIYSF
jgi:hypothetical protein